MTKELSLQGTSAKRIIGTLICIVALGISNISAQRHYAPGSGEAYSSETDISALLASNDYFCLSFNGYTLGYVENTGTNSTTFPYKCVAMKGAPRIFIFVTATNPKKATEQLTCLATIIDGTVYYIYYINGNEWYLSSSINEASSQQRLVSIDNNTGRLYLYGNPGWSTSTGSRRYLYISSDGQLEDVGKPEEVPEGGWDKPALSSFEKPQIEFVPIYNKTLKGKNNKLNKADDNGDMDVDNTHRFLGVVVKSVWDSSEATGTPNGILSEDKIIEAIESEIVSQGYAYSTDDPSRGILYIDMKTYLNKVDKAAEDPWNAFNQKTADNCLYFLPSNSTRDGFVNFISGTSSCANIIIKDRQPFFNPMEFNVKSGSKASYTRVITGGDESSEVTQGSLILPFDVPLTNGNACGVTFYTLGEVTASEGADNQSYNVTATPVTADHTEANRAYHTSVSAGNELYTIESTGATIAATPNSHRHIEGGSADMDCTTGNWTICGNYCGESSLNASNKYFYNSSYFWLSSNQKYYSDILVGPFRAYFNLNAQSGSKIRIMLAESNNADDVKSINQTSDVLGIYDLNGVRINAHDLSTLSRGIYIVNGKKVAIK